MSDEEEEENRDLLSDDKRTIWVGLPPLHPGNIIRKLPSKFEHKRKSYLPLGNKE